MIDSTGGRLDSKGIPRYRTTEIGLDDTVEYLGVVNKSFQLMEEGSSVDVANEHQVRVRSVELVQEVVQWRAHKIRPREPCRTQSMEKCLTRFVRRKWICTARLNKLKSYLGTLGAVKRGEKMEGCIPEWISAEGIKRLLQDVRSPVAHITLLSHVEYVW